MNPSIRGRSHRAGRLVRTSLAAGLIALTVGAAPTLADPAGQSQFAAVRAATAKYHDLATAQADGYGLLPGCFEHAEGGMGVHYVKGTLVDGTLDPTTPEALVYEPLQGGGYRLVAVEYVVIASLWQGSEPPSLFGQSFGDPVGVPNEFGVPVPFYELHVWLWQPNPSGMFEEWNPAVSCAAAG